MAILRFMGVAILAGLLVPGRGAAAKEEVRGPVNAEVVRVVDGDTIEIVAQVWIGLRLTSRVRIRGIDTPELHGACAGEREMAEEARQRLTGLVGDAVSIAHISDDKYAGRVLADAVAADGTDIAAAMLASGLARPYDGGRRAGWCAAGAAR
jgi:endonuclease YncB( thermonuclease family)